MPIRLVSFDIPLDLLVPSRVSPNCHPSLTFSSSAISQLVGRRQVRPAYDHHTVNPPHDQVQVAQESYSATVEVMYCYIYARFMQICED